MQRHFSITFNSFFSHFSVWFNLILLSDILITLWFYSIDILCTTCNLCIYICCCICLLYWYFMVRYKSNMAQWIRDPPFLAEAWVASQSVQEDIGRQLTWIVLFWKKTGWWFQFFCFHPENWGRWTHFDKCFSKGLKPPTRRTSMNIYTIYQLCWLWCFISKGISFLFLDDFDTPCFMCTVWKGCWLSPHPDFENQVLDWALTDHLLGADLAPAAADYGRWIHGKLRDRWGCAHFEKGECRAKKGNS